MYKSIYISIYTWCYAIRADPTIWRMRDIYAVVGERVRQERQRAGLTLEQLAERADISASFLSYIETKSGKASLKTIQKLSEALKMPVADLFKTLPGPKKDAAYDAAQQFIQLVRDRSAGETAAVLGVVRATVGAFDKKNKKA